MLAFDGLKWRILPHVFGITNRPSYCSLSLTSRKRDYYLDIYYKTGTKEYGDYVILKGPYKLCNCHINNKRYANNFWG